MAESQNVVISFSIAMFFLLILLVVVTYNSKCQIDNVERFNSYGIAGKDIIDRNIDVNGISSGVGSYAAADPLGPETYKQVEMANDSNTTEYVVPTQIGTCANRDRLTSSELLPSDTNSKWAELNPQCSGDIQDQNFLTAGNLIGINTVGQSMRNANLQLRYEPPNPQVPVSPWQISTIEPENRIQGLMDVGQQ